MEHPDTQVRRIVAPRRPHPATAMINHPGRRIGGSRLSPGSRSPRAAWGSRPASCRLGCRSPGSGIRSGSWSAPPSAPRAEPRRSRRPRPTQRLHERGQHVAQQIRLGTLQVLSQERGQLNRVGVDGHRGDSFRRTSQGLLKITRWPSWCQNATLTTGPSYTTSLDSTLLLGHIKGEWPHLEKIRDPGGLESELDRVRPELPSGSTPGSATSPPTTNTTGAETPSARPAATDWPEHASKGSTTVETSRRANNDRASAFGWVLQRGNVSESDAPQLR